MWANQVVFCHASTKQWLVNGKRNKHFKGTCPSKWSSIPLMNECIDWASINSFGHSLPEQGSCECESGGLNTVLVAWPDSPSNHSYSPCCPYLVCLEIGPGFEISDSVPGTAPCVFSWCAWLSAMARNGGGGGNWSSIKLITIMLYQETHCLLPHWLKKKNIFHWKTSKAFECFK